VNDVLAMTKENDQARPGPFKEKLMWMQHPIGAQPKTETDLSVGHVKYRQWLDEITNPQDEIAKNDAINKTAKDAETLYHIHLLVGKRKGELLTDLWGFDKQKLGYVSTDDFHRCLQISLDISKQSASLVIKQIPFEGKSGSIAYRRWVSDFCRSPSIDWQSYLNMNLLAEGRRELDMQHAQQAMIHQAKIQHMEVQQATQASELTDNRYYRSPSAVEYPRA